MRRRSKACLLFIPLVLMLAGAVACRHYNLYVNLTSSLPRGVYQLFPGGKIARGDVVLVVELDEIGVDRALCPYRGLLKQAAAFGGDTIDSDGKYILVNGRRLPYSDLFTRDKYGKDLPQQKYPYIVPNGAVYLTSQHKYGYDSRYYGPISIEHIAGKARLLFSFPNNQAKNENQ